MLELKNIELFAGESKLLKETLSVNENTGQCLVFFGRNGKGKSTLLKQIAQHGIKRQTGIFIQQIEQSATPTIEWSDLCTYSSGRETVNISISVLEFILTARLNKSGYFGIYSGNDLQIANKWVSRVGIEHLIQRSYENLSDGEKQLVQLARTFCYETPVILLDEPTSNLDIPNKKRIIQLLHDVASSLNKLIIYTSHDFDLSAQVAKRCWFIDNDGHFHHGEFSTLQKTIRTDFDLA